MSTSLESDARITYDGTPGIAYTKFKHNFEHYLIKHVTSKGRNETTKIDLLEAVVNVSMEVYTPAQAWLKDIESALWDPKHSFDDEDYVADTVCTAKHLVKRFWRLADKEFMKASKADLMEWHQLFQEDDETPASFGARFKMYKNVIQTILPIPCDWTTYVCRLQPSIALNVGTQMDILPVSQQNMNKAISIANAMWEGIKLRDFLDTMSGHHIMHEPPDPHDSITDASECEDIGENINAAQDTPEQPSQNQAKQIDPQKFMALMHFWQTSINNPISNASVNSNHAPPYNTQSNRPLGAVQQVRRCNTCGDPKHTVDGCFIGHPDIAPQTYLGPRNEQKRALWNANRVKLGMHTVPMQDSVVQPSTSSAPQVISYAVDASVVARRYKQCFVKANAPGASSGIVSVESHARTMNHQEMPVGFNVLESDLKCVDGGQQASPKARDIKTDVPGPVIAESSIKVPDHYDEVIPVSSSGPTFKSIGGSNDAPVVTHDDKVTIQLTVSGNSDLSIDVKPKNSSHALVPALSSAFVDHTKSIMKLRKCHTGLYYLTGTTPAETVTLRPSGSTIIMPSKLLKDEGSNACLMDAKFAQEHNIAYSSGTAIVNTASGTPVDALGVTEPFEFTYAYGTEYETSVRVACIVMATTGGLYDVLLGTNATQPVNAHVQPLFQRLYYMPRLQQYNDADTVHHLPIKVVPSGHSAVVSANIVQLPASNINQASYMHTSKDVIVGFPTAMQQHAQHLQTCPSDTAFNMPTSHPVINGTAELYAGVRSNIIRITEEPVDGGQVETQQITGQSGYLPLLACLGAWVSQVMHSHCKRVAEGRPTSQWINQVINLCILLMLLWSHRAHQDSYLSSVVSIASQTAASGLINSADNYKANESSIKVPVSTDVIMVASPSDRTSEAAQVPSILDIPDTGDHYGVAQYAKELADTFIIQPVAQELSHVPEVQPSIDRARVQASPTEAVLFDSSVTLPASGVPMTQTNYAANATQEQPDVKKCVNDSQNAELSVLHPFAQTRRALNIHHLAAGTAQDGEKLNTSGKRFAGGGQKTSKSQIPSLAGSAQLSNKGSHVFQLAQHQPVTLTSVHAATQSLGTTVQLLTCTWSFADAVEPESMNMLGALRPVHFDLTSAVASIPVHHDNVSVVSTYKHCVSASTASGNVSCTGCNYSV